MTWIHYAIVIRKIEQRDYNLKVQLEIDKKKGEYLGVPGKERQRTKMFQQIYTYKPELPEFRDTDNFDQYLMTNDNFKHIEEYKHVLKKRREEAKEELSSLVEEEDEMEQTIEENHMTPYQRGLNMVPEATNEVDTPTITRQRPFPSESGLVKSAKRIGSDK